MCGSCARDCWSVTCSGGRILGRPLRRRMVSGMNDADGVVRVSHSAASMLRAGVQVADERGNAVVAEVDCHALGADRDPIDEQPDDAGLLRREQGIPEVVEPPERLDDRTFIHGLAFRCWHASITRAATSGAPIRRRISAMTAPSTMAAASAHGPAPSGMSRFRIRSIDA